MKKHDLLSMTVLCLAVAFGLCGCSAALVNGGGTLPSASGNAADRAIFGFYADACTPGVITGTFNYLDRRASGWPDGGVKLNGVVVEAGKCSEGGSFNNTGITCGICNLQFCKCPEWPSSVGTCIEGFLADPVGFCEGMAPIPDNLYGVSFQFTSTNPRYPGGGLAVACITDNGQGVKAIDKDDVVFVIVNGQYQGYVNKGAVRGNIGAQPCLLGGATGPGF